MKNIPIRINQDRHYDGACNASGHGRIWTDQISFMNDHRFGEFRRNSDPVRFSACDTANIFLRG